VAKRRLPLVDFDSLNCEVRLWFLAIFQRDIREARFFAQDALAMAAAGIDDRDPHSLYCRSHDAAIVRYARCFLACRLPNGAAATRLPDRYLFEGTPLAVMHNQVIAARHGIVAHADMRERQVTLTKFHESAAEPNRWQINTSNGNLPPTALMHFASLCELHRKKVVEEIVPLVESRLSVMKIGETIALASTDGGAIHWSDALP
jgi:hypothetical protein